jgi:hypothetical protein
VAVTLSEALDEAPVSRFHTRAIFTAGMGFFTDAYDLFIIGTASGMIAKEWHLSTSATNLSSTSTGLINSITLTSLSQARRAWLPYALGPVFELHVRFGSGGR